MEAVDVTEENFEQVVIGSRKTVLVDFSAEWCPPCRAMEPILELLASELDGKALIGKLDVDLNPQLTAKYGVRSLPTFLIFKDGSLIERIVGAVPKSILGYKISSLL